MSEPRSEYLVALFSRCCGNDPALLKDWMNRFEQGSIPCDGEWRSAGHVKRLARRSKRKSRRLLFELGAVFLIFLTFDLVLGLFVRSLYP